MLCINQLIIAAFAGIVYIKLKRQRQMGVKICAYAQIRRFW